MTNSKMPAGMPDQQTPPINDQQLYDCAIRLEIPHTGHYNWAIEQEPPMPRGINRGNLYVPCGGSVSSNPYESPDAASGSSIEGTAIRKRWVITSLAALAVVGLAVALLMPPVTSVPVGDSLQPWSGKTSRFHRYHGFCYNAIVAYAARRTCEVSGRVNNHRHHGPTTGRASSPRTLRTCTRRAAHDVARGK